MKHRSRIIALVAVIAAAGAAAGIVATRAQGSTNLPQMSAAQLLAKVEVANQSHSTTAVSGNFSWSNNLLGSGLAGLFGSQASAPTNITSLLMGGSGRLWIQHGSGLRLEAQGSNGDLVLVAGKNGVWTYSSATGTATQYTMPAGSSTGSGTLGGQSTASPTASPQALTTDPLAIITADLQRFASTGTVSVSGQQTVAGQQAYILTVTPASGTTTFGSLKVAIDGSRYVPLSVQVFAKSDSSAMLSAGFTSVSYASSSASLFSFTPPAGATVKRQAMPTLPTGAGTAKPSATPLSLAQIQAQAKSYGLALSVPATGSLPASLPFVGGSVTASSTAHGATATLHYGQGFGSVVLVESQVVAGQSGGLTQQLAKLPQGLLAKTTVGGQSAYELTTPLFSMVSWQQGSVVLAAGGMVPSATLTQFTTSLK
jgi:outer membrane lipoprotein-sorting protein